MNHPPRAITALLRAVTILLLTTLAGCFSVSCGAANYGFPHSHIIAPAWFVCGIIGAWIATSKNRGGCSWFLICAILGPFGIILAAVVSKEKEER